MGSAGTRHYAIVTAAYWAFTLTDGTLLKVYAWYDNEMGYACRMVDLACHMESVGL
jgi:glyceraldehyde-3-phosphate dehydrogenase/erythrose-4-phosphate dehydrogenase